MFFILRKKNVDHAASRVNRFLGPLLIPLFWIHGILFDPPNNWATLKNYGFFKFWFMPQNFFLFQKNSNSFFILFSPEKNYNIFFILIAFGLIGLSIVFFINLKRQGKPNRPSRHPYPAFFFWYLTATFLHHKKHQKHQTPMTNERKSYSSKKSEH